MENCGMSAGLLGEGEAQMPSGTSMSHAAMVQQAAAILNNECEILKARIIEKTKDVEEVKQLCARQAENIAKQQSELEHYKVKAHSEEMQNKAHLSKIYELREKLQVVDKYFDKWGNTINPMLQYQNELEEIIKRLKAKLEMDEASYKQLEKENNCYLEQAEGVYLKLQEHKEREKIEFDGCKVHLRNELAQNKLQGDQLEQKFVQLQNECREKGIAIDILEPQRAELKNTLDKFKTELDAEKEQMNITSNQLETSLYEIISKKNQLSSDIETANKKINEINNALREKELEITMLDNKHKELIAEEEEYTKINKIEQQQLQELESTMEELTVRFNTLRKIDLENVTLKADSSELENENEKYKRNIAEIVINEEAFSKKIKELNKCIEEVEIEKEMVINDKLVIEEKIQKVQKEQNEIETEHNNLSAEIDKTSAELQDDVTRLQTSMQDINEQLLMANETKKEHDLALKKLEGELAQAKAISQESDFKLFSYNEECNAVRNNYHEEIKILEETLELSKEDYEQTMADCKLNEDTKIEVHQLTKDLENKHESYPRIIQELQEGYAAKIESKSNAITEMRAQCEREYKNKELLKTDHLVELKETKARIVDLERQKTLVEKEIKMKIDVLRKSDSLIQKMETKFSKVAQVARTSSQSGADPASQQTYLSTQSGIQRKRERAGSPDSESSGKTFDPDEFLKKIPRHRPSVKPFTGVSNPQSLLKKNPTPAPAKKKNVNDKEDLWASLKNPTPAPPKKKNVNDKEDLWASFL